MGPAGTGKWLLDSQEFINWREGEARTLCCYGIRKKKNKSAQACHDLKILTLVSAGAGKTILAYDPVPKVSLNRGIFIITLYSTGRSSSTTFTLLSDLSITM